MVAVAGSAAIAEPFGFSANAGVAPTTMGTVGETLSVGATLPPVFRLSLSGTRMTYLQSASEMELYGSDVFGDTSRKTLAGTARLGAAFTFRGFSLEPWGMAGIDSSDSYTIVRLLEPGSGFPQDTTRFMDVSADETVIDAGGGLDLGYSSPSVSIRLSGFLSPMSGWTIESQRFLTNAYWPVAIPSGQTQPVLSWTIRDESLELTAVKYSFDGSVRFAPRKKGVALSLFGSWSHLSFAGVSDIISTAYIPYKAGNGSTPVENLPLELITSDAVNPARVELSRTAVEAGLRCELLFLKERLKTRGSPAVSVSWSRHSRSYDYRYLDVSEDLSAEKWVETANFFKFALTLGLDPR